MLLALLLACRPPDTDKPLSVVIVVVDGVRVEEAIRTEESELSGLTGREHFERVFDEIAPQGTLFTNVRNMGTTITAPAHANLVTGTRTSLGNMAVDEGVGLYRPDEPTLFEELRDQLDWAESDALVLANQSLIEPVTSSTMPGYGDGAGWLHVVSSPGSDRPAPEDAQVFTTLGARLDSDAPRLVMANLKAVDRSGHYGDDVDSYLEAITKAQGHIADFWATVQAHPDYADNTVLIVTSDHGRHRDGDPSAAEYWRDHGTSVEGDRQIPVLLIGPGIEAGIEDDTAHALTDIAPTVAELFGAELGWATGLPMRAALTDEVASGPTRSGVLQAAGPLAVELTDDPGARSVVTWDGEVVSDASAWAAEGVAYADGLGCWREVLIGTSASPWVPRCRLDDGTELPAPVAEVSSLWRPHVRAGVDGPELSFIDNPDDIAQPGVDGEVGPIWLRLVDGAWVSGRDPEPALRYPTDLVTVDGPTGMVSAFIASPYSNDSRGDRSVYVQAASWGETFDVGPPVAVDISAVRPESGDWRVERPALLVDGEDLSLLVVGMSNSSRMLIRIDSTDGGASWGDASVVAEDPDLVVHMPPRFAPEPTWVVGDDWAICDASGCTDTGGPVRGWADEGIVVRVDGVWTVR
ncbi:MAG: sulfatase-like hydrolase/transferase [Proteobacteria bacterium]|nr:sulfatase-like hydrolase/transferase [Pseudomonadota bacterium]